MKKTIILTLLFALSVMPAHLTAADDVTGSFTIGVMGSDTDGTSAKFDEYRDMDDGAFGDVELRFFRKGYYLDFSADSIGRSDESFDLKGGRFGSFSWSLFYDEIPHHLAAGAKTFYNGAGGESLFNTGVASDPTRWNEVDYRRDRQNYGFDGTFSFGSPFFIKFGAAEKNTDGVMPWMGNSTISGFGRTTELPAPVDWSETTGFVKAGYTTKAVTALVKAEFSDFRNDSEEFLWEDDFATNPAIAADATSLAPDNEFWKVSGQLTYRAPFMSSVVALRGAFSQLDSGNTVKTVVADDGNGTNVLHVDPAKFDGDISYGNLAAAWKLSPADGLDLEVFVTHLDKNNDNTIVEIEAGGDTAETEIFDYTKTAAGLDGTYGLGATDVDFGYSYTTVDREGRHDNKGSDDNLLFLQLRNRSLERLELRGRYEFLTRDGDFSPVRTGDDPTASEWIRNFLRRFDVSDQDRQAVELEAATWMGDALGLAVEFSWRDSDYDATELGLQGLTHYDVYLSADYAPSKFSAGAYAGFENDETDLDSRRYSPGDFADPAAGNSSSSAYNWSQVTEYDTFAYGLYLEVPLTPSLTCKTTWNHSIVDGSSDFSSDGFDPVNFDKVEDYDRQEFEIDLIYALTERLSVTAGYIYERFDLDDEQWDDYSFAPNSQTLLGGAYVDSDYDASVGFLLATFSF